MHQGVFTILHISDLHQSSSDPISNDELISALVGDCDRYADENPRISNPNAIIVSGDIIQGVPLGAKNFKVELENQYANAEKFLGELVNRFLSGDRSRIIIIPGNHDVDWNTAFKSMKKVEPQDLPPNFAAELLRVDSAYRWDWKNQTAYKIDDLELYSQRLDSFWQFFHRFYSEISGLLGTKTGSDVNLFSLCDGRIGLAAFNSCDGNDCFAVHGMIKKDAIARSHLELMDSGVYNLLIGVWHHNIEGPPYRTDYMDIDVVRGMIGRGFRLGLYGHQHRAQATPHQIWLPGRERMAAISAGSLCAGRYDLPTGIPRQYNILQIGEDFRSVRVHVREMTVSNLFSRGRFPELGDKSFVDLDWEPPKNPVGEASNFQQSRLRLIVNEAEIAAKTGNPQGAVNLLSRLNLIPGSYERSLFLTAAKEAKNWEAIIRTADPPSSIEELIQMFDAFSQLKDFSSANNVLDHYAHELNFPSALKAELQQRLLVQMNIIK
jgi:Calcineurin-like phosphoesterase